MQILVFSDLHGDWRALERLLQQPADVYIAAGDLSVFGRGLERLGELLRPLGQRVWVLPGNHETEQENREFCERYGLVDFHRQQRHLDGTCWVGLGYSNPTPFDTPGEYSEEEIAEALAGFGVEQPLYAVVHCPPYGTALDEVAPGRHAGSRAVREWVERVQPVYLFCGHIHECAGRTDRLGRTVCVNVGKAGYRLMLEPLSRPDR
jgi:Icc-related predicted phosphoesterase